MQEKLSKGSKSEAPDGTRQTKVRKVLVDREREGQRIDNFLRGELPGVPQVRVYRSLRRVEVRVTGWRVPPEAKLH